MIRKNFSKVVPLFLLLLGVALPCRADFTEALQTNTVKSTQAEPQTNIPVVFASDDNYAPYMYVAMYSMLKNAHGGTYYDFYLLIPNNFAKQFREEIIKLAKFHNCSVSFIEMDSKLKGPFRCDCRVTPADYRLLAPELLPQHDKCIYLDSDVLVLQDLSELYNLDLDGYYLAGVSDLPMIKNLHEYLLKIGLPEPEQYINSGVLVLNLKAFRENDLTKSLIEKLKYGQDGKHALNYPDQDVLNLVCFNKIKHLNLKFNIFPADSLCMGKEAESFFGKGCVQEAIEHPAIIHYVGDRPWYNKAAPQANLWWKYARMTPFYEELLEKCVRFKANRDMVCCVRYRSNQFHYWRCKILSHIAFGKTKRYYQDRAERIHRKVMRAKKVFKMH